jgi:transposase InsO family protein
VENQCDARIKCLRSDRGGEFHFPSYCESVGIIHETSIAYTPQQNGVAESYIEKVLKMFNQFDCKPVCTPFDASMKLYPNTGRAVNQLEYARVKTSFKIFPKT